METESYSQPESSTPGPQDSKKSPVSHMFVRPPTPEPVSGPRDDIARRDERTEPGSKQIRINITIDYPENLFNFRRHCRVKGNKLRFAHGGQHRFLKVLLILLYNSFVTCGAISWHIRQHWFLMYMKVPILVIATFSPFADAIGNMMIFHVMRKEIDPKKPSFRHTIVFLINILLLILHFVVMVFAITWIPGGYGGVFWRADQRRAVIGMILYSTISMIIIKLILFGLAILRPKAFERGPSVSTRWSTSGYEALSQNDARSGRVRPGTVVDHDSDEEETPKNSMDRVRLV